MIFLSAGATGWLAGLMGTSLVSVGAFGGGLLAVWLVYRVSTGINGTSVATMLLMGVAVSALSASLTGLLDYYADNEMRSEERRVGKECRKRRVPDKSKEDIH